MTTPKYDPLVQDLVNFVYRTDDRYQSFCLAIESAKDPQNGGDAEMLKEGIENLEDYFQFCHDLLKWVPVVEENTNKPDYDPNKKPDDALLRKLLVFYWVFNQTEVAEYQTSIKPEDPERDPTWLSYWQVVYSRTLGSFLSTKESTSGICSFYNNSIYNTEKEKWQDPPQGGWASFNQFFSRKWKDINIARPLAEEDENDNVIVSAADSQFGEYNCVENGAVVLKSFHWRIERLLQGLEDFKGVSFMHAFLSPSDYHRQHAPVSGKVVEAKVIQELVYLQVTNSTDFPGLAPDRGLLVKKPLLGQKRLRDPTVGHGGNTRILNAPDEPGYQWCQTRGVIVIQTDNHGKVAVLPVGMAQVSSVVLTVKKDEVIEKGQEISYFQFGGSDVVLVFENDVHYSAIPKHKYNVRSRIATFR